MSQINVNDILPESGNIVNVNGVEVADSNQSIKIGVNAGPDLGIRSTAVGRFALNSSTGQSNTALGCESALSQTTGFGNTAVGTYSLRLLTTTNNNTAVGYTALSNSVPSSTGENTAIGSQALLDLTTGNRNTAIGMNAGSSATTGDNNTFIGFDSQPSSITVSNELTLGNSSVETLRCAVTSITSLSDARDKTNIEDSEYGLDLVDSLKPVKFEWDTRDGAKKGVKDLGFIAQDLKELDDEYLGLVYGENPDKLEASYGRLIPVLVKAIQELSAKVTELEDKLNK
jgi:hypothetical protein